MQSINGVYQTSRGTAAEWAVSNKPIIAGLLCIETDTGRAKLGDGVTLYSALPYFVAPPKRHQVVYTATSGQTTFAVNYTNQHVDVWLQGIKLIRGVDFTCTTGTSVVLTTGVTLNAYVECIGYLNLADGSAG